MFKFFKSQLLKVIDWEDKTQNIMVYKFPMNGREIMFGSKLTVRESQVAIFCNKGKIADVFQPGIHTLRSSNLPYLTKLLSLPYGFKSPFTADVYFVNTKQFTNLKWGTSNPITMRDRDFGSIRIRGYGTYAIRVIKPDVFLKELFGTNSTFKTDDIQNYLRSLIVSNISDAIAESKVSALDLACNLIEFNKIAQEKLKDDFEELGLKLTKLTIENISFPESVEKAIDTRSSIGIMGDKMDSFVKYQAANAMRESANNPNSSGSAAGLGVGLSAGATMGQMLQNSINSNSNSEDSKKSCPNCGHKLKSSSKFCVDCGYNFETGSKTLCNKCGTTIKINAKFCPECGASQKIKCKKCGTLTSGKFCHNCGNKN